MRTLATLTHWLFCRRTLFIVTIISVLALLVSPELKVTQPVKAATTWTVCPIGCNYTSIQAANDAVTTVHGDTIMVFAGTYIEDVAITKSLIVMGAGVGSTTVSGPLGGNGATFTIQANNVELKNFKITREGNNAGQWNDPTLNSAGIAIQGAFTGANIHDNLITQNRTGIDINGGGYDAVPGQFAVEIQSPVDAAGQRIVTAGLSGNLITSQVTGAAQVGIGQAFNEKEVFASFSNWLTGGCQARATISTTSPRVPNGLGVLIPTGQAGSLKFNVGAAVGLIMTPRTAPWRGIRTLHKTAVTTSTLTIPVLTPVC